MLSASLLYLNSAGDQFGQKQFCSMPVKQPANTLIYDDVELPSISEAIDPVELENAKDPDANKILEFTRTSRKSEKQLPLLGMPDKAFYHIH